MFKLVVLSCLMAVAASSPIAPWGLGLGLGPLGVAGPLGLAGLGLGPLGVAGPLGVGPLGLAGLAGPVAPLGWGGVAAAPVLGAYNYRGPLSLAPGQPANILAADGRPLDTLSVNLDRAAHITAKAVSGHVLKKRSAPLIAPLGPLGPIAPLSPLALSHSARIDLPTRLVAAPAAYGWGAPYGAIAPAPWGGLGYGRLGLGLGNGLW